MFLSQSQNPESFKGRNFMFVPTPSIPPSQGFGGLIILSGVATIYLAPANPNEIPDPFLSDQVILGLDVDFEQAIQSAPYTLRPPFGSRFLIAQAVPFATVNSRSVSLDPNVILPYATDLTAVDAFSSEGAMIQIDVRVQGKQSQIIALGYHLSLYGHLVDSGVVTGGGVD